jgi:hypothetical protein
MLIHRKNSHAPSGKQRAGRREAQSRERRELVKKRISPLYLLKRKRISATRETVQQVTLLH